MLIATAALGLFRSNDTFIVLVCLFTVSPTSSNTSTILALVALDNLDSLANLTSLVAGTRGIISSPAKAISVVASACNFSAPPGSKNVSSKLTALVLLTSGTKPKKLVPTAATTARCSSGHIASCLSIGSNLKLVTMPSIESAVNSCDSSTSFFISSFKSNISTTVPAVSI